MVTATGNTLSAHGAHGRAVSSLAARSEPAATTQEVLGGGQRGHGVGSRGPGGQRGGTTLSTGLLHRNPLRVARGDLCTICCGE